VVSEICELTRQTNIILITVLHSIPIWGKGEVVRSVELRSDEMRQAMNAAESLNFTEAVSL